MVPRPGSRASRERRLFGSIQQTTGSGDQQSFASAVQQFPICDASTDAGEVRMGSHYDLVYQCHGPCLSG
ncbi:hypothetical protein MCOR27_007248 [Pyricularia oryzae]|uniref:Uncharacterized protein n=1 Tax=Pyricularia grisea TaxID=148305 RepID=A0ABQ8P0N5_PYRGI|nr:hypothetical protein MCOR01_009299 [Pyricularia oryzae]KAI6303778.1 hypothetical protein MCOR33_001130 [Pyricularia grisea]KAH9437449.1 hypothetical protein MCOR02_001106 [Pyricularia oryzae]KAI6259439.1 hypothetical protein MCOR19_004176 [Pyricularia oryzae]KAI6271096.1 hypothetical protein MCOR26_007937 [Pyricularia oryzae]